MDQQSIELSKSAGRAAIPYAGGAAAIFLVVGLVPVCGGCFNFFLSLAAFVGIAYFITPKLTFFPAGQSKGIVALAIGAGVSVVVTIGFVIATIISNILWLALSAAFSSLSSSNNIFGNAVGGTLGIVLGTFGSLIYGLVIGTGLAFLGAYLALNKMPDQQPNAMRPF